MINEQELKAPQQEGLETPPTPPFQSKLVRSLIDQTDIVGYRDKVWFYQTMYKPTSGYGTKYLKDYFCYNCKGPFSVVEKVDKSWNDEASDSKPIFYHKMFLKDGEVEDKWGYVEDKHYYEGWCCHCWATSNPSTTYPNPVMCDCGLKQRERINEVEVEIKDLKEEERQLQLWANKLNAILTEADKEKLKYLKEHASRSHRHQQEELVKVKESIERDKKQKARLERHLAEWNTFIQQPQQNKPKHRSKKKDIEPLKDDGEN